MKARTAHVWLCIYIYAQCESRVIERTFPPPNITIIRYAGRGVSSTKGDVHKAIKKIDKGLYPRAFCKVIPDVLTNDPEYAIVMHADGKRGCVGSGVRPASARVGSGAIRR